MIKKLIAVTAAFAAVATMSAAAFAATGDVTATYDADSQTVTAEVEGVTFSDQVTVVITEVDAQSITSENIYFIDQDGSDGVLEDMGMMESAIEEGKTYEVRIGCTEGDLYVGTFTVGSGSSTPEYPLGDANLSGDVTGADGALVLNAVAGNVTLGETAALCADVNKSGDITGADGAMILNNVAGNVTLEW
jgi:hypothetical protein